MTDTEARAERGPSSAQGTSSDRGFFGQPTVLANIFGVELWERFSFYGMQGIVLIYLYYSVADGGLGVDRAVATSIVGGYGGTVYLSTILGAWLADRMFGPERMLFYSAAVVMCGHIALSLIPGLAGVGVGLVLIALGSGGVKANATSLVGSLYDEKDERRDAGFSLFYLGINLGALTGPLLTGLLQSTLGFHIGFAAAAVGMAIGLVQYAIGRRKLGDETRRVPNPLEKSRRLGIGLVAAGVLVVIVVLAVLGLIPVGRLAIIVAAISLLAAIAYFTVILRNKEISDDERSRVRSFIPMFVASAAFWALYQQQFTVVTIYSDVRLDRNLFGWTMPVSWVQSINPVMIIVLSGVFAAIWTKLGSRQPSTPVKFGLGLGVMGLAFLLFLTMSGTGRNGAPLLGLVGVLLVFTIAELLISPVGLSLATKLAPTIFGTQMVALLFLSIAIGTALAGFFAGFYDPDDEFAYFGLLGGTAIVLAVVLLLLVKPIRSMMRGVR